ncbi:MAG: hypothetical protein AAF566_03730 [Pseudomonadota bacterium]
MTTFIYRGTTYTPTTDTAPRGAQTLIYRGQSHDGVTAPRNPAGEMRYRGATYLL